MVGDGPFDPVAARDTKYKTLLMLRMGKLVEAAQWQQRAEFAVMEAQKALEDLLSEAMNDPALLRQSPDREEP